jgi:hypothetical protein
MHACSQTTTICLSARCSTRCLTRARRRRGRRGRRGCRLCGNGRAGWWVAAARCRGPPRLVERLPNSNPSFTTPYPNPCILRASRHAFHGRSHADRTRPPTAHLHHLRPGLRQACLRARAPQPRASRCQGNRHTSACNIQHTASWPRAPHLPASCCCPETPAPLGARLQSVCRVY